MKNCLLREAKTVEPQSARRGRAGADTIYNDLRTRFPGANPQPATPTPGP